MNKNHTAEIEKLVEEVLSKYAKENELKITSSANYVKDTITINIYK